MSRRTTTTATPSDLPKIDLAQRYLELTRLRQIVQKAERRIPHMASAMKLPRTAGGSFEKPITRR
jgi:hypothetical protein